METDWEARAKDFEVRHKGAMESLLIVQAAADAALQKIKDDNAAHEAAIEQLKQAHAADLEAQAKQLSVQHVSHVEALKRNHLIPALTELHARQAADLTAKQLAEVEKLEV